MKILVGDHGSVDFDAPIRMTDEQKQEFIDFMKSMFAVVEEEYTDNHRTDRIGDKFFTTRKWTAGEYTLLFQIDRFDNDQLAKMLGRTPMSIHIRRGLKLPIFLAWVNEKGVDLLDTNIAALVVRFMRERVEQIISRRQRRKELRQLKKRYESMTSGQMSTILQVYQNLGDTQKVNEFNRVKAKLRDQINRLEQELERDLI